MVTAKTTVKKTAAPVKTAYVKKTEAVGMSGTKLATAKVLTKADLQEQVKSLTQQLKVSEDMRLSAVQYRDKLSIEKGELARKNAELLKEKQDAKTEEGNLRRLIERQQVDIEKLLGDNRTAKQFASDYAKQVEHLTSELNTAEAKLKNERSAREAEREHLKAREELVKDHVDVLNSRLNKVPSWIRSIFGA